MQVHLRLQWRENEREADAEATVKFSFEVCYGSHCGVRWSEHVAINHVVVQGAGSRTDVLAEL